MRKLVVYYIKDKDNSNTKFIAENVAKKENADIFELKPKQPIQDKGFMKYFWGSKQVLMKEKPDLEDFPVDPSKYDRIYIGTPVCLGTLSPAIRTFLTDIDLRNKEVGFFCCSPGSEHSTFKEMKQLTKNATLFGQISFNNPLQDEEKSLKRLDSWLEGKTRAA